MKWTLETDDGSGWKFRHESNSVDGCKVMATKLFQLSSKKHELMLQVKDYRGNVYQYSGPNKGNRIKWTWR